MREIDPGYGRKGVNSLYSPGDGGTVFAPDELNHPSAGDNDVAPSFYPLAWAMLPFLAFASALIMLAEGWEGLTPEARAPVLRVVQGGLRLPAVHRVSS